MFGVSGESHALETVVSSEVFGGVLSARTLKKFGFSFIQRFKSSQLFIAAASDSFLSLSMTGF
jgi:hypothetical protein